MIAASDTRIQIMNPPNKAQTKSDRIAELERELAGVKSELAEALASLPLSTNRTREAALKMLGEVSRHPDGADLASHGCVDANAAIKAIDVLIGERDCLKAWIEALQEYAHHGTKCLKPFKACACNCGLDELLEKIKPTPVKS